MKNITIIIKMLVIVLLLTSCDDNFLDVNDDPNNPTSVSPDLILPVAQSYSAFTQERNRGQNTLGNMMMYNWSQSDGFSWYTDEFAYLVTPSFYAQIFDYTYSNVFKQYNALEDLEGEEYGYYHAISRIMKSYHFQILVDTYGDVPYFEALQRGGNPTPAYDDQSIIYEDLITQLTAAIDLINATAASSVTPVIPGADDTMFGGNMTMWKKFANTVKLRILVRQSDVSDAGYIKGEFTNIASEGSGFITDDITVQLGYVNEDNKMNPKWAAFGQKPDGSNTLNNDATCATDYILQYLTDTFDPRIDFIYEEPEDGHLGVKQGELDYDLPVVDQWVPEKVSNLGPGILKGFDQDAVLYTAAEVYFNQCEAVYKGLMAGDAKSLYEMGIQASFDYLGVEDASSYYSRNSNLIGWDGSSNKLEAIITQKWIALNSIDAIQSWFDYSRTGYPSNLPISATATSSDRPVRLAYPSSELTANGGNLPSQPNVFSDKIFWAN
ncbi:MAG: SusD/RagB family nutrient-binding outer membrane lipoprotein [Bacteroidota bacterium]